VVSAVLADVVAWLDARTEEKAATLEEPVAHVPPWGWTPRLGEEEARVSRRLRRKRMPPHCRVESARFLVVVLEVR